MEKIPRRPLKIKGRINLVTLLAIANFAYAEIFLRGFDPHHILICFNLFNYHNECNTNMCMLSKLIDDFGYFVFLDFKKNFSQI
jgi:hypothetical protein